MQNIINFIKYHNLFTIILVLVFIVSASALANENVRDTIIGQEIVSTHGVDNSQLLSVDLDSFDLAMTIIGVSEDNKNYYVDYAFNTLGIENNIWQPLVRGGQMNIAKIALGDQDLGLYLQEELGEIIDYELAYLYEVQTAEREKGETQVLVSVDYTGLTGLVLDIKDKILPGYEPVVQLEPIVEIVEVPAPSVEVPIEETFEEELVPVSIDTIIGTHPQALTTLLEATFEFQSTKEDVTFQCKINTLDWLNCTSPKTYPGLTTGDYLFQVFATDPLGNYDHTPAIFSWTIVAGEGLPAEVPPPVEEPPVEEPPPEPPPAECTPLTYYLDFDTDTYGDINISTSTCDTLADYIEDNTDCNDQDPQINPGATETCDGIDNNCNTEVDEAVDCGATSCDATLNLTGQCQNTCAGADGCGTCTPSCSCTEGFSDCDADLTNGCEVEGACI